MENAIREQQRNLDYPPAGAKSFTSRYIEKLLEYPASEIGPDVESDLDQLFRTLEMIRRSTHGPHIIANICEYHFHPKVKRAIDTMKPKKHQLENRRWRKRKGA